MVFVPDGRRHGRCGDRPNSERRSREPGTLYEQLFFGVNAFRIEQAAAACKGDVIGEQRIPSDRNERAPETIGERRRERHGAVTMPGARTDRRQQFVAFRIGEKARERVFEGRFEAVVDALA